MTQELLSGSGMFFFSLTWTKTYKLWNLEIITTQNKIQSINQAHKADIFILWFQTKMGTFFNTNYWHMFLSRKILSEVLSIKKYN
jgi:hypothetical protein